MTPRKRNAFTILELRAGKRAEWNLRLQAAPIGADDSHGVLVRQGNIDRMLVRRQRGRCRASDYMSSRTQSVCPAAARLHGALAPGR